MASSNMLDEIYALSQTNRYEQGLGPLIYDYIDVLPPLAQDDIYTTSESVIVRDNIYDTPGKPYYIHLDRGTWYLINYTYWGERKQIDITDLLENIGHYRPIFSVDDGYFYLVDQTVVKRYQLNDMKLVDEINIGHVLTSIRVENENLYSIRDGSDNRKRYEIRTLAGQLIHTWSLPSHTSTFLGYDSVIYHDSGDDDSDSDDDSKIVNTTKNYEYIANNGPVECTINLEICNEIKPGVYVSLELENDGKDFNDWSFVVHNLNTVYNRIETDISTEDTVDISVAFCVANDESFTIIVTTYEDLDYTDRLGKYGVEVSAVEWE